MTTQVAVIENEGGEYGRLAENLLNGKGYVSIKGQPNLMYAPLYPWLIAGASLFTGNTELAGRIVSLLAGVAVVITLYLIANLLYGIRTALMCAFLAALHPVLIGFSAAVYNEMTYLALMLTGIYFSLLVMKGKGPISAILGGAGFGLAYLVRPEALGLLLLSILILCCLSSSMGHSFRRSIKVAGLMLASFALVSSPYVAFISRHIGRLSFEGKSRLNYTIGQRVLSGMSYSQAACGISEDLEVEGPLMDPYRYAAYSPFPFTVWQVSRYALRMVKRNTPVVLAALFYSFSSCFLVGALIGVSFLRKAWNRIRLTQEIFLLSAFGTVAFVVLSAHAFQFRYLLPLIPFLIIWTSHGIVESSDWVGESILSVSANVRRLGFFTFSVSYFLCALVLLAPLLAVQEEPDLTQSRAEFSRIKQAGVWLRTHYPEPEKLIATTLTAIPYYARGRMVSLPFAGSTTALRYLEMVRPDFLVLLGSSVHNRPYLKNWIEDGIQNDALRPVYTTGVRFDEKVVILRWLKEARPGKETRQSGR